MVAKISVNRKPSGAFLALIVAPLALIVLFGAIIPRLRSEMNPQPGVIDWAAMHGYELSVARKYPNFRHGYETILYRDQYQLAGIDHRISRTTDPEKLRGLRQQRLMVTSGINVVQQILDHFPRKRLAARAPH